MILESVGGALGDLLSSPKIPSKVSNLRRRITMLKVVLKTPSYHSELTTGKEGHDDAGMVCHHGPYIWGVTPTSLDDGHSLLRICPTVH